MELAAARHPQQSPQRSEVFLEGVFFSLNPRPHIYLGAPEHEHKELTFRRRTRPRGSSDHSSLNCKVVTTMTGTAFRCCRLESMAVSAVRTSHGKGLYRSRVRHACAGLYEEQLSFRTSLRQLNAASFSLTRLVIYSLGHPLTWFQECRCVGSPRRPDPCSPRACLARQSTARRDNAAT